jgi:outer membrane protein assembly factor BamB
VTVSRLLNWLLLLAVLALAGSSCAPDANTGDDNKQAAVASISWEPPGPLTHRYTPGTPVAWITSAGDEPDTNYCNANLSLPLVVEPAWEYSYGLEFSPLEPTQLVHLDGTVYVVSACPQLLGLDTADGTRLFQRDVYMHADADVQESIVGIFIHPSGEFLTGRDRQGRLYCWQTTPQGPEIWHVWEDALSLSGFVTSGEYIFGSWHNRVNALSLVTGRVDWSFPHLYAGFGGGIVTGAGYAVFWTAASEFHCFGLADGSQRWAVHKGVPSMTFANSRAVIDAANERVYLVLADERVECRRLDTGELEWSHSWSDLGPEWLDPEEPQFYTDPVLSPEGLVIPLLHGVLLALDHDGNRRWVSHLDALSLFAMGFGNGVLVSEVYLAPEHRSPYSSLIPYQGEPPAWDSYRAADPQAQGEGVFSRFVVVDMATGKVSDALETDYPTTAVVPAYDKIVFGEAREASAGERRIVAYDWIDWETE